MTDKAQGAPERIWAERSPISGEEWWTAEPTSLGIEYMQPYILATPAALAASPEVAALIREAEARGYNNWMLSAISVVAEERNKRNPGPLFEVLNKALGKIDDARFSAIRKV